MNKITKTKFGSHCIRKTMRSQRSFLGCSEMQKLASISDTKGIPDGCKYCIKGEKLVLFVTGKCSTRCPYCPLSDLRKDSDKMWANERECNTVSEVLEEAKESNAKGAGITGGDPLLVLNKTLKYAKALKKEFGRKFHIHIYLSTKLVSEKNLKKLSSCVDEVRFHPEYLLNEEKHALDTEKIKIASKFFNKKNIGIEVPIFPDKRKDIFSFIEKVKEYISFVNLNELEIGDSNFYYVLKKYKLDKNGYTVADSIKSGKWIMKQCLRKNIILKVHLCTAKTKNWFQYKNRLVKHSILPFGKRTKDGTVIYYSIFKDKNNKKFEKIKKQIKKEEGYYDERKKRIILNKKFIEKYSSFAILRTEEYPTYDGIIAESFNLYPRIR